ncbi:MAG: hypothetical protein GXP08_04395 [Gammaproteobacteria bacterium]|nr:hypothetical protein [Gammaproteobacteria bacterium]
MIPKIKNYLQQNAHKFGLSANTKLDPLILFNVNYNYVESYPLINRVVLWFNKDGFNKDGVDKDGFDKDRLYKEGRNQHSDKPVIVSKIVDPSLSRETIDDCHSFQHYLNKVVGYNLFLNIIHIVDVDGKLVIFEEAEKKSTYETELKFCINGPERSLARFQRTYSQQMLEMGDLCEKLSKCHSNKRQRRWGDQAYQLATQFKKNGNFEESILPDKNLVLMRDAINKIETPNSPVLADLVCPNIFPGPRLIDNLHPNLRNMNRELPGIINVFRFIVSYFYSPPVQLVFQDWLYTLAAGMKAPKEKSVIANSLQALFAKIGLDCDTQADTIWGFIMYACVFEMQEKLDFYQQSPFMITGKIEQYCEWSRRMTQLQTTDVNVEQLINDEQKLNIQR